MNKLKLKSQLGKTNLHVSPIIFGTSCLGNLYQALGNDTKREIISEWFKWVESPVVIDTAGKYGAGLALEVIGKSLGELGINADQIIISNKLGWYRTELKTPEPTFEPGVWMGLEHDAVQKINYKGILECWEQGNELLGGNYNTEILSVHDPDEYITQAQSEQEREKRLSDVIEAYHALTELRKKGKATAIGVGAKDWRIIRELTRYVDLDWIMLAISLTIMKHTPELLEFIEELTKRNIGVINSAVFHGGFLTGSEFFDYRKVDPSSSADKPLFRWRELFHRICNDCKVKPSEACVQFGISPPGIISVALNTSKPERVKENVEMVQSIIPDEFWAAMKRENLIDPDYPFLG